MSHSLNKHIPVTNRTHSTAVARALPHLCLLQETGWDCTCVPAGAGPATHRTRSSVTSSTVFWVVKPCIVQIQPNVSEEDTASILRVEARNPQKHVIRRDLPHAVYSVYRLLRWFSFDPEDGGKLFFRNVGISTNYTALQPNVPCDSHNKQRLSLERRRRVFSAR